MANKKSTNTSNGNTSPAAATRYHHGDLRQALLDEAAVMLEEVGADGISLRALARRVGVSHAAPGHHFADRSTLLAELAATGFQTLHQRLHTSQTEAGDSYVAAGRAYVDVALEQPHTFKLMFGGLPMAVTAENCPPRLAEESTKAFLALLQVAGVEIDPDITEEDYTLTSVELRTWALVHGAATLFIDGALRVDEITFRQLVEEMLVNP